MVFEEVGINVPNWVRFLAIVGNASNESCQQYHTSLGLSHIRRFAEAKTPEERRNSLPQKVINKATHCASLKVYKNLYIGDTLCYISRVNRSRNTPPNHGIRAPIMGPKFGAGHTTRSPVVSSSSYLHKHRYEHGRM